jgi:hypothetical protein
MTDYQNGILLAEAYLVFAPRSLVRKLEEAREFLRNGAKTFVPQEEGTNWPVLQWVSNTMLPAIRAPMDIHVEMQEKFLAGARKGKFKVLGYRLPRNPSDPAVQIPPDLLESQYVNWDISAVKGAGLEFANGRAIKAPKIVPAAEDRLNSTIKPAKPVAIPESRRKRGRPRTKHLDEAYNALNAIGALEPNAKITTIAAAIQEWIKQHYPACPAKDIPGYETIRLRISELRSKKQ